MQTMQTQDYSMVEIMKQQVLKDLFSIMDHNGLQKEARKLMNLHSA